MKLPLLLISIHIISLAKYLTTSVNLSKYSHTHNTNFDNMESGIKYESEHIQRLIDRITLHNPKTI